MFYPRCTSHHISNLSFHSSVLKRCTHVLQLDNTPWTDDKSSMSKSVGNLSNNTLYGPAVSPLSTVPGEWSFGTRFPWKGLKQVCIRMSKIHSYVVAKGLV